MGIYATKKSNFITVPDGTYVARCVSVIDLGTQVSEYNNETKFLPTVIIGWELPTELHVYNDEKGEEPLSLQKIYTLSLHEKSSLYKDLLGWQGQLPDGATGFDLTQLVGQPCQLTIIEKKSETSGNLYNRVTGVSRLAKGQTCPPQITPSKVFSLGDFDMSVLEQLSQWTQDKIMSSPEYKALLSSGKLSSSPEKPSEDPEQTSWLYD